MKKTYLPPVFERIELRLSRDILKDSIEGNIPVTVETLPSEEPSEWLWDDDELD